MAGQTEPPAEGNVLHRFVGAFVDELARAGVRDVCLCPGSRSTPLAIEVQRHPDVRTWVHLDERSCGFFALGMAKARGAPVAILCTSGTAAVNFAPAVVEAWYGRVPLLILTADRPPELRDVGAPQTIDQRALYGGHTKWFHEAAVPEATADLLRYARTLAGRAAAIAGEAARGPVHLNFPFREPLVPSGPAPATGGRDGGRAFVTVERPPARPGVASLHPLAESLRDARRGVIVCGQQDDAGFPAAVTRLAAALDYPILADPLSQVRRGPHDLGRVIDSYDAFLASAECAARLEPEVILRFGGTPVSKPLAQYMQRHAAARQIVIDHPGGWSDFTFTASDVVHVDPAAFCGALIDALAAPGAAGPSGWTAEWLRIGGETRAALRRGLSERPEASEPGVFAALAEALPEGAAVFTGNSMPVRDLDTFFAAGRRSVRLMANRGASGIDGVVSSALGASAVVAGPLVLAIGDISFYHDMNGLLAASRFGLRATIVLLNNDGGGIFSFLPQATEAAEGFEELFGTPHGLDFRPVAELYGLRYERADTDAGFRAALRRSLDAPGAGVIEVRTGRGANVELHRRLLAAVGEAVQP